MINNEEPVALALGLSLSGHGDCTVINCGLSALSMGLIPSLRFVDV